MRRCRTIVVGLSAVTATAVLASGLQHARAAQTRGMLQVTVQVTAPCAARLDDTGKLAMAADCASLSAPFAVATEGPPPALPADTAAGSPQAVGSPQTVVAPEASANVRYITLFY